MNFEPEFVQVMQELGKTQKQEPGLDSARNDLYFLVQLIPEERIPEVRELLESFFPFDDEPLTEEEIVESEAGWQEYQSGKFHTIDEVIKEQLDERED